MPLDHADHDSESFSPDDAEDYKDAVPSFNYTLLMISVVFLITFLISSFHTRRYVDNLFDKPIPAEQLVLSDLEKLLETGDAIEFAMSDMVDSGFVDGSDDARIELYRIEDKWLVARVPIVRYSPTLSGHLEHLPKDLLDHFRAEAMANSSERSEVSLGFEERYSPLFVDFTRYGLGHAFLRLAIFIVGTALSLFFLLRELKKLAWNLKIRKILS
ncbi:MAG: hypothetical protein AAGB46_10910 [Verrucomicrobiota bacterium]